ncbi:hypothetical protein Lal_00033374 [Lupinus albus]|nr:hypothetical protein Lal_00033374 [Lupinus albus]
MIIWDQNYIDNWTELIMTTNISHMNMILGTITWTFWIYLPTCKSCECLQKWKAKTKVVQCLQLMMVGVQKLVLRQGGHVVDATVATVLCLGVVFQTSTGIGDGATMVVQSSSTL